jgi:hypothetical protein
MRTWKLAILLGLAPILTSGSGAAMQGPHGGHGGGSVPRPPIDSPEASPFNGYYERIGTGKNEAFLDVFQVGPDRIRLRGSAKWVEDAEAGKVNTGQIGGTAPVERLKAHFENQDGCALDILFQAEGLKIEKTAAACGGPNVTFDGEYKLTGPSKLGRDPSAH